MKLKAVLFLMCLGLLTHAMAANLYFHPRATQKDRNQFFPNPDCYIELINDSYEDVNVYGIFDDGISVNFSMYSFDAPYHIDLFYDSFCHSHMYLNIETYTGTIYSGWTEVNTSFHIVPYMHTLKAEVRAR
jgi:hypothetical protein